MFGVCTHTQSIDCLFLAIGQTDEDAQMIHGVLCVSRRSVCSPRLAATINIIQASSGEENKFFFFSNARNSHGIGLDFVSCCLLCLSIVARYTRRCVATINFNTTLIARTRPVVDCTCTCTRRRKRRSLSRSLFVWLSWLRSRQLETMQCVCASQRSFDVRCLTHFLVVDNGITVM